MTTDGTYSADDAEDCGSALFDPTSFPPPLPPHCPFISVSKNYGILLIGNKELLRKTLPQCLFSTKHLTLTLQESNPNLRDEKLTTNHLTLKSIYVTITSLRIDCAPFSTKNKWMLYREVMDVNCKVIRNIRKHCLGRVHTLLAYWRRNNFFNFKTPCI